MTGKHTVTPYPSLRLAWGGAKRGGGVMDKLSVAVEELLIASDGLNAPAKCHDNFFIGSVNPRE